MNAATFGGHRYAKNAHRILVFYPLFYIYFFALSLLAVSMLDSLDRYNPLTYTLVVAASFFILSTIQTAIHEAGHLLFGLLSGWRFGSFRLYSWIWLRENGKLRVKRSKIAGTTGQCLLIPPETEDGKTPYTLYNMGGVLLNLISAALLGALGFALKDSAVASFIAFVLAVQGLYSALLNGIPMRYAMVSNDGSNQRQMCKFRRRGVRSGFRCKSWHSLQQAFACAICRRNGSSSPRTRKCRAI